MKTNKAMVIIWAILLVGLAGVPLTIHAQSEVGYERGKTQMEDVLPPSPEAASAVKYADVPFTHSMGAAEYSIPLYELKGRELSIPIGLRYCSNGIKVDEIAGVAGLGWNLEAGGVITREVVYMPDEFQNWSFYERPDDEMLGYLDDNIWYDGCQTFITRTLWHQRDRASDRYSYSVAGLSGTFIVTPDKEIVQLSGDGVKIELHQSTSTGPILWFTITGPDGTRYVFSEREMSMRMNQRQEFPTYATGQEVNWTAATAWYLTSIHSADNTEKATFTYANGGVWDRDVETMLQHLVLHGGMGGGLNALEDPEYPRSFNHIESRCTTRVLTGITLKNMAETTLMTASFEYAENNTYTEHKSGGRSALKNNPRRLTGISVNTKDGLELVHYVVDTYREPKDGRILLRKVEEYHQTELTDRWNFTYKTLDNNIYRWSQDWFGYYNDENVDEAETLSGVYSGPQNPDGSYTMPGGNVVLGPDPDDPYYYPTDPRPRWNLCPYKIDKIWNQVYLAFGQPVASHADYMMLKKADHDGAVTEYEYEGAITNDLGIQNAPITLGVRVKRIIVKDGTTVRQCRSFAYSNPRVSGNSFPRRCDYLSLDAALDTTGGNFNGTAIQWTFSIHEGHAGPGIGMGQSRVFYGQVTETVHPSPTDTVGARTVYSYDTESLLDMWHSTVDRFPSYVDSIYNMQSNAMIGAYNTKRVGYYEDGPVLPPFLIRKDSYRLKDDGNEELYSSDRYTYSSLGLSEDVLVDYQADELFRNVIYHGMIMHNCVYHYPVVVTRRLGRVPTRVERIGYHSVGQDSTVVEYSYVARPTLDKPIRVDTLSIAGCDGVRRVRYTYADTWPASTRPSWASALDTRHSVQEPLIKEHVRVNGTGDITASLRSECYYKVFTLGNGSSTALMPEYRREMTDGVESWSENVQTRDSLGNPSAIKERGRPLISLVWGYDGMYPISVTEGEGNTTLTTVYTWSPGVGITSVTTPTGTTTSYTYDVAGRLTEIRDNHNHIKESYDYNLLNTGSNRRSLRHQEYRDAYGSQFSADVLWWNTLGMRLEDIAIGAGGAGQDIVSAYEGDYLLHDDNKRWLPYPSTGTNGSFQTGASSASATYHGSSSAYNYTGYEQSDRDRVAYTYLPGYGITHKNTQSDNVRSGLIRLVWTDSGGIIPSGEYPACEVLEECITDADNRVRVTLRDRFGTVLATEKKRNDGTGATYQTRYVYDLKGRLRVVIGDGLALTDTLNMWRYSYDSIGRVKSKGIPGCEREFYTYDGEDRIIAVRRGGTLTETEYDALGRILKVWVTVAGGQRILAEEHRWDTRDVSIRDILGYGGRTWAYGTDGPTLGLETYVMKSETNGNGGLTGNYLESASIYDEEGRPVYVVSRYHEGLNKSTAHTLAIEYDFSGNVVSTTESCTAGVRNFRWNSFPADSPTAQLTTQTSYDLRNRPIQIISNLNGSNLGSQSDTTSFTYDALGRPSLTVSKASNGGTSITIADSYTLQGWLQDRITSVGSYPLFEEALYYEAAPDSNVYDTSWTGHITAQDEIWTDPVTPPVSTLFRKYYRYDAFGRIDKTKQLDVLNSNINNQPTIEEWFSYDGRGNLLRRDNFNEYTILPYEQKTYSGDCLVSRCIKEPLNNNPLSTVSFTHDALGRMTHDGAQNLDITYNYLDLPEKISRNDTLLVKYLYLADGMKMGARSSSGNGLEYRGTMTFRRNTLGTLTFESVPFFAGRMTADGIQYHVTDHLGSVRAVVDGATGSILEASDYSAFGTRRQPQLPPLLSNQLDSNSVTLTTPFRHHFTGQEEQAGITNSPGSSSSLLSLPYTDFGARQYSPTLSRWLVPDPMSEKYYDVSPYAYCANDPVNLVDPYGMDWYKHIDNNGIEQFVYDDDVYSQEDLENKGINGQYVGQWYNDISSKTYYSLFGTAVHYDESDPESLFRCLMYMKIDRQVYDYYFHDNSQSLKKESYFFNGTKPGIIHFDYNGQFEGTPFQSCREGTFLSIVNNQENSMLHIENMPRMKEYGHEVIFGQLRYYGAYILMYNDTGANLLQVRFRLDDAMLFREAIDKRYLKYHGR